MRQAEPRIGGESQTSTGKPPSPLSDSRASITVINPASSANRKVTSPPQDQHAAKPKGQAAGFGIGMHGNKVSMASGFGTIAADEYIAAPTMLEPAVLAE
jgi:hypothetical protein